MNPNTAWRSWSTASLADTNLARASGSMTSANVPVERLVVVRPKDDSDRRHGLGLSAGATRSGSGGVEWSMGVGRIGGGFVR
jgi:hypothetical protein